MSISSISNPSNTYAYPLVLQQGTLTLNSANPTTVPCAGIVATDTILIRALTQTAPADALGGTGVFACAITAGTGFVATVADATTRGTYYYVVIRSNAPDIDATSAP
jgi:hypothetical protein